MDFILIMSIMQLVIGIALFTVGLVARNSSGHENKKRFFNKIKNQGILNLILSIVAIIMQVINEELGLISMAMYAIGILFTTVYLLINLIFLVKNSTMSKNNRIIIIIGILLFGIFIFLGDTIYDKFAVGYRKLNEPIKIGKEFLLYECNDKSHGNEKVYMTINKIEKDNGLCVGDDESQCTVMDFDLRYEGKKPIKLVNENRSFSDLCSFTTIASSDKLKDNKCEYEFLIEDDMDSEVIHSEYTKNLPKVIKAGAKMKNIVYPITIMGDGYDDISVKDMNLQIETGFKMQHEGKNIRESINK
ncbi:hypothetical protein [Terrisporobacter mayombei]|uniref:Uncharacterized protein n=1 Tax=Terrisporobacter mayombei TaxID=1541 RepID=A0ABY9Q5R2_9FIRM|nr:hypothetical protein [Terrisporobacter mayombei]MCC3869742.1 hypothetical protein [Terrisporobacter mayombei]WMT83318.1 hypothetical protein TEMA_38290 [Terrisporobacter mayombei]